jgi:hypothetical protein
MEEKRDFWRTVKVRVTPGTKEFFQYCNRKGYVLSKKITELLEIYADYIAEKEKAEVAKESTELKQIFKAKGV